MVPDKNWGDIENIIANVTDTGVEGSYKSVFSNKAIINGFEVEGAYSVALFYARELMLIEKNVKNLERILFFYNIPEKLVDKEEAKYISKEILKEDQIMKWHLEYRSLNSIMIIL